MLLPIFITHQNAGPDSAEHYTFRGAVPPPKGWAEEMSLLALSHTPIEHALYAAMLKECAEARTDCAAFSVRHLMLLTGLNSYSTVRRGRNGLLRKKSIEADERSMDGRKSRIYKVFCPLEIFRRRQAAGIIQNLDQQGFQIPSSADEPELESELRGHGLSRRQAQVAIACLAGATNSEIGSRLNIGEQTVKFHLSHVFVKIGVKRRTELISKLLTSLDRKAEIRLKKPRNK